MKLTPNNKQGYLQVTISFFVILCSMYLLSFKLVSNDYYHQQYAYHMMFPLSSYVDALEEVYPNRHLALKLFYTVLTIIHIENIFIQSKKRSITFAIISGAYTLFFLFATYFLTNEAIKEYQDEEIKFMFGAYFIMLLAITQILTPIIALASKGKDCAVAGSSTLPAQTNDSSTVAAPCEKELLEKELLQLQAQVKQIEKEETERKLELERAEKEILEKENLKNEIAKLKEFIKNHENK